MKTFLNVLYRRILYRIPLKWLLVLLFVVALSFASFSHAELVLTSTSVNGSLGGSDYVLNRASVIIDNNIGVKCSYVGNNGCYYYDSDNNYTKTSMLSNTIYCFNNGYDVSCDSRTLMYFLDFMSENVNFPTMTSLECQTEYSLIPVSSVDSNYCITNNLCPSCPSCPTCPSGGSGRSNVYINDILHVGAPNIIMNISEEIDRDYAYTAGGNNMNIDVVGYNVDYDKIDTIIENQSYKPTGEDFQKIIGILGPYTKIIVFFVFLFIVWAWIKKPFKSKKL